MSITSQGTSLSHFGGDSTNCLMEFRLQERRGRALKGRFSAMSMGGAYKPGGGHQLQGFPSVWMWSEARWLEGRRQDAVRAWGSCQPLQLGMCSSLGSGAQPGPQKDGSLVRTSQRGSAAQLWPGPPPACVSNLPGLFPHLCYCCIAAKSRLTLGHPKDCSPPGSSVDGISQARILE